MKINADMLQHELLVMILSPLSMKDLSHALSVSKQFNKTILDSMELRRTLFLESGPASEYLQFLRGRDQRCYETRLSLQPVIGHAPLVEREAFDFEVVTRVIVDAHPVVLGGLGGRHTGSSSDIEISLSDYSVLTSVPASAFLFQPPL